MGLVGVLRDRPAPVHQQLEKAAVVQQSQVPRRVRFDAFSAEIPLPAGAAWWGRENLRVVLQPLEPLARCKEVTFVRAVSRCLVPRLRWWSKHL